MEVFTVIQLKELLRQSGAKTSGNKNELICRLTQVVEESGANIDQYIATKLETLQDGEAHQYKSKKKLTKLLHRNFFLILM